MDPENTEAVEETQETQAEAVETEEQPAAVASDETPAEESAEAHEPQDEAQRIQREYQRKLRRVSRQLKSRDKQLESMQRDVQALKEQIQGLRPNTKPRLENFENVEEYEQAIEKWVREQPAAPAAQKEAKPSQKATDGPLWVDAQAEAMKDIYPDFKKVVTADVPMNDEIAQAIIDSDQSAHLAYYLCKNEDELEDLLDLDGAALMRAIGRIEAKLPDVRSIQSASRAPKPVTPVKGSGDAVRSPQQMTPDEYRKWRESQWAKGSR